MSSLLEGINPSELCVRSAVTVDVPPGIIEFGAAVTVSTSHGSKTALVPVTAPHPNCPDQHCQPHQLFSKLTVWLFALSIAVIAAMMRLKWALTFCELLALFCRNTPVAKPVTAVSVIFKRLYRR